MDFRKDIVRKDLFQENCKKWPQVILKEPLLDQSLLSVTTAFFEFLLASARAWVIAPYFRSVTHDRL